MARETNKSHSQNPSILYHELSSAELLAHAKDADSEALEQLYYQFRDQILKYVWSVTGNHDAAVDTVKEVFNEFFAQLETADEDHPSVKFQLFQKAESKRATSNEVDPVTAQSGWELSSDTLSGERDWTGPSQDHQISDTSERFVSCFSSMPEPLRVATGLFLLGSFTVDDIMRITSESADAIRARIDEGLRRLRVGLQENETGKTRTHTGDCSMAGERSWLQFHMGESVSSDSSNLVTHREKCEECKTVSNGIETLNEHLNDFRDLNLAPFPKGDESDLLKQARETAVRLSTASPDTPDMDPDLKQVLWLLPWGLVLVIILSVAPMAYQHWFDGTTNPETTPRQSSVEATILLDTDAQPVKHVTIAVRGDSALLDRLEVVPDQKLDGTAKTSERPAVRTYRFSFPSPFPTRVTPLLRVNNYEKRSSPSPHLDANVREATNPDGKAISARVYLNIEATGNRSSE